jgi:hypothetical protein
VGAERFAEYVIGWAGAVIVAQRPGEGRRHKTTRRRKRKNP